MKNLTTREHYEKYAELARVAKLTLIRGDDPSASDYTPFGSLDRLQALYQKDENLNNIPLARFDAYYNYTRPILTRAGYQGFSLADNTCLYKHLLYYQVLKCEPVLFETYGELQAARKQQAAG